MSRRHLSVMAFVAVVLTACDGGPAVGPRNAEPGGTSATTRATVRDAEGKPQPPLRVELTVAPDLTVGTPFDVTLTLVSDVDLARARAEVTGSGVVTAEDATNQAWDGVAAGQVRSALTPLRIGRLGEGEIRGSVEVLNDDGSVRYGRSASVSVLATETEVLTGGSGILALRLVHLDREREAGRLTEDEYRQQRDQVLGGGASEPR